MFLSGSHPLVLFLPGTLGCYTVPSAVLYRAASKFPCTNYLIIFFLSYLLFYFSDDWDSMLYPCTISACTCETLYLFVWDCNCSFQLHLTSVYGC
jgi:hypothetical protein